MPPMEKTNTYERGTYYFFDAINWRRVAKEFHLDYDRLESRQVPMAGHGPAAAAAAAALLNPSAAGPPAGNLVGL